MINQQIIPVFISDSSFKSTEVSPHIYFYNGTKNSINYYINYGSNYTDGTLYPYFDVYDGQIPSKSSKSLLFYNEDPLIGTKPDESLYTLFWDKYISTLYDNNSRLIEANAIIPLYEYLKLTLNDIIEFKGNYYHLRYINNYDLNSGECNIQLLGPIIYDSLSAITPNTVELPNVDITGYSNVAYSFTINADITSDGSSTLLDCGFVYSTSNNLPTISDTKISKGTSIGNITHTMDLTKDTTYYLRAYAQNKYGIYYTDVEYIIITSSSVAPVVQTNDATNITISSVNMNGNVVSTPFGSITERGFCWGTASNPTISGNHQAISGTIGTMVLQKYNEFIPGQLMHYRAYAKNNYETAYGIDKTFTIINKEYTLISRVINNSSSIFPILTVTLNADTWLNSENFVFTDEIQSSIDSYTFTQKIYNTSTVTVYAEFTTNNNQVNDAGIFDGNYAILNTLNSWDLGSGYVSFDFKITYDNNSSNIYVDFIITD